MSSDEDEDGKFQQTIAVADATKHYTALKRLDLKTGNLALIKSVYRIIERSNGDDACVR